MIRVLVVDDSALMRKLLTQLLSVEGDFVVETARNGRDALAKLGAFNPDVVTLDVQMPEMDGLTCLDRIMLEHPCPVVMVSSLTARGADETLTALELGAVDFVTKPAGAISLQLDTLGPIFVEKIRMAAGIRLKKSRRLSERLRHLTRRDIGSAAALPRPSAAAGAAALVLVGCSTGGPPALDQLLSRLPSNFPLPIVVAQHMPATFTGPLARRLDQLCAIGVSEVGSAVELMPGHAYIGRGDADMVVSRRRSQLLAMPAPSKSEYPWHPSVDRLVESAMEHVAPRQLIGILMTGMGDDGAAAMARLCQSGGHTIAEAKESAVVWGMPGSLVALNGASETVALDHLAERLLAVVS